MKYYIVVLYYCIVLLYYFYTDSFENLPNPLLNIPFLNLSKKRLQHFKMPKTGESFSFTSKTEKTDFKTVAALEVQTLCSAFLNHCLLFICLLAFLPCKFSPCAQ